MIYHRSDDIVAVRCGNLEVSLQRASGVQCMDWYYRRPGNRPLTREILRKKRMVYTSVGVLEIVLERFKKIFGDLECLSRKKVLIMITTLQRLLNSSIYLVPMVVLHYIRCTARKRATATHTHISQLNIDYCKVTLMYGRCPFPGLPTGQVLLVTHLCWLLRYRR